MNAVRITLSMPMMDIQHHQVLNNLMNIKWNCWRQGWVLTHIYVWMRKRIKIKEKKQENVQNSAIQYFGNQGAPVQPKKDDGDKKWNICDKIPFARWTFWQQCWMTPLCSLKRTTKTPPPCSRTAHSVSPSAFSWFGENRNLSKKRYRMKLYYFLPKGRGDGGQSKAIDFS